MNLSSTGNVSKQAVSALAGLGISTTVTVVLSVVAGLIFILDLIGNSTVIHVIRSKTPMRTTTDLLIINLAIADLQMVLVIVYMVKHFYLGFEWFGGIMGQITCRLAISLQALSVLSSVYTISAICVDRFFAVFFPLRHIFTKSRIKLCIAFIWFIAMAFAAPQFMIATAKQIGSSVVCVPIWKNSGMSRLTYNIYFVVIGYFVPLVIIAVLYLITGITLWKSSAPGQHSELSMKRIQATRRKPTKMMISIVVAFALCWLPLYTAEVIRSFARDTYYRRLPMDVNVFLPWFGIANSAINPFIYPIFCEKFRTEFKKILCFPFMYKRKTTSSDSTVSNVPLTLSSRRRLLQPDNNVSGSPQEKRNVRISSL